MEKWNITYLASLKFEESNNYNSNCLLYQRCWLLCTYCGEYKGARKCGNLENGAPPEFFYSTQRTATSSKNIAVQNIVH
jgi:hypothetical protein